jgi:hypothetical protein
LASCHPHKIATGARPARRWAPRPTGGAPRTRRRSTLRAMPANWIWIQAAIVLFVLIGMIVAITKLV